MTYELNGVEYIPDASDTAEQVKCPLVNGFIQAIDCMENQVVKESSIPVCFKVKPDWKAICNACPFRDY